MLRSQMSLVGAGVVLLAAFAWAAGSVYANRQSDQGFDVDGVWNADVGWWQFASGAGACGR